MANDTFPSTNLFRYPVLKFLADGETHTQKEIIYATAKLLSLSEEDMKQRTHGGSNKVQSYVAFSVQDLRNAEFIKTVPSIGYAITEAGKNFLERHPDGFLPKDLEESESYRRYKRVGEFKSLPKIPRKKKETAPKTEDAKPDNTASKSITVRLSDLAESANANLPTALLEAVKQMAPKSFEVLIKKLLVAMGYGKTADDVIVTQYVADGGIDGYVRKDRLNIEKLCAYQAKRYTNTNVGINEMNALGGAMINYGTTCGILATTTDFTPAALNYNPRGYRIVRINGKDLVNYLIEYGIGVRTECIEVKTVDVDFLNNL